MTQEIINRTMQVFLYTGGIVAFWQITKHMPKALYNLLECITILAFTVLCVMPIAGLIEYILIGNIDITMMYVACLCFIGLLSTIWLVVVQSSRALQGKNQYKYIVM